MPLSQSISVLFLCCKMLRNVANHFPISSSTRNPRIQAFAFFSLFTIIQVVGGLYGEVLNIFRQNLVCCGRAINSRLAVEGSIKGFKPSLASLYKDPDHIKRFLDILFETFFLDNFQIFTSVFALTSPPILPPVLHLCGLTPSEYRVFRSL